MARSTIGVGTEAEVVPLMKRMTVPELVHVTGLSRHYCWQVRAGRKRLHPMHWGAVCAFDARRARRSPDRNRDA
jgi:hypothetical protein